MIYSHYLTKMQASHRRHQGHILGMNTSHLFLFQATRLNTARYLQLVINIFNRFTRNDAKLCRVVMLLFLIIVKNLFYFYFNKLFIILFISLTFLHVCTRINVYMASFQPLCTMQKHIYIQIIS